MGRWPKIDGRLLPSLLAAGLGAAAACADASVSLRFARHDEPVGTLSLDALAELGGSRTIRVFEPYEEQEVEFRALPFERVLDAVYSPSWRREDELLFTCLDGYQPSVPVARFLAHHAWLAYERADRTTFTIWKRESGRRQQVELGPFYLIWDNLDDAQLRRDGDYGWPYQLVGVELIRSRERFAAMAPPADAGAAATRGFAAFRVHCSRCHAVNGEGGGIGPELNARPEPVGARDADWLRRWIDDPSRFTATARMPALNPALPDRSGTIDALVAYLRAMAGARPEAAGGP